MSFKKILLITLIVFILIVIISGTVFGIFIFKDDKEKKSEDFYYNVGQVYSNLNDAKRILKLNLTVSTNDEKLIETFEKKSFLIKDELYKILRNKSIEDIEGKEGQIKLKQEIISNLNKIFKTDKITNIYFDELIVQ